MRSYEVLVEEPGPLYLRLSYEKETLKVNSWDPTPHGGPGPIESLGLVRLGDALVSVNNNALHGLGFQASILAIKQARRPCVLHFQSHHDNDVSRPNISTEAAASCSLASIQGGLHSLIASNTKINERRLRNLASSGLPEDGYARPIVWRILLQYLPVERHGWSEQLAHQRKLYSQFLREFCIGGSDREGDDHSESAATTKTTPKTNLLLTVDAHYLSVARGSEVAWRQLQLDSDLQEEIHKDVIRTHPDLPFFREKGSCRHETMKRILFVYAKLNPGVRYVQGMNEILGTLYFVFATDKNDEWSRHSEADAFFCFTNLMADMRDLFIHSLDDSEIGLNGKMSKLNDLLKDHDPELWKHFLASQLDPSYYSLRWMTTLLVREFSLSDTIRLWDTLFAKVNRTEFLCHFCVVMLKSQRNVLLQGDFTFCLSLLQNYPSSDPVALLKATDTLIGQHSSQWELMSTKSGFSLFGSGAATGFNVAAMIALGDRLRNGSYTIPSWFGGGKG